MTEDYLQYAWKYQMFNGPLKTSGNERVLVISTGDLNKDSGPDFFNAQVVIGGTRWAGNVEIHINSSDWYRHGHQKDEAYDNVILHVVYNNDKQVFNRDGSEIPVLELRNYLKVKAYKVYRYLIRNRAGIPCQDMISAVDPIHITAWKEALLAGRLERKVEILEKELKHHNMDMEKLFIVNLFRVFGYKVNKLPFELTGKSIPVRAIKFARSDLICIEALLFGQAGMLEGKFREKYLRAIRKEYQYLKSKYGLEPVEGHLWKYMRLRPVNFPTIRLAQLASLIHREGTGWGGTLLHKDYKQIKEIFRVEVSDYWKEHFLFGKKTKKHKVSIGPDLANQIVINLLLPFSVLRSRLEGRNDKIEGLAEILYDVAAEENSITRYFSELGLKPDHAADSQSLIELKTQFCDFKRCLDCRIGHIILKRSD